MQSKFEAYTTILDNKVNELVQNELKKLTTQPLENKSARSLFDDDLKQDTFTKVHPVKKELQSPQPDAMSCQLYPQQCSNEFEMNQTQHDSNAASVCNQDFIDSTNLM